MIRFNKVAIVSRHAKSDCFKNCQDLLDFLLTRDLEVYLNQSFGKVMNYSKTFTMDQLVNFDLVIAFGGDGTILWAARHAVEVPILGINAGHLGFLTSATLTGGVQSLERVLSGDYVIERCMRLQVSIDDKLLPTALNECYITNRLSANICDLNIFVNGNDLGQHLLDGIIVSTPVGSTAYALSAGGSIIEHSFKAMQIVPVNSVARRMRPFVLPAESKIKITIPESFEGEVIVINDGILECKMDKDSKVEITKAEKETVFIRFAEYGFFDRLQEKLDFNVVR